MDGPCIGEKSCFQIFQNKVPTNAENGFHLNDFQILRK